MISMTAPHRADPFSSARYITKVYLSGLGTFRGHVLLKERQYACSVHPQDPTLLVCRASDPALKVKKGADKSWPLARVGASTWFPEEDSNLHLPIPPEVEKVVWLRRPKAGEKANCSLFVGPEQLQKATELQPYPGQEYEYHPVELALGLILRLFKGFEETQPYYAYEKKRREITAALEKYRKQEAEQKPPAEGLATAHVERFVKFTDSATGSSLPPEQEAEPAPALVPMLSEQESEMARLIREEVQRRAGAPYQGSYGRKEGDRKLREKLAPYKPKK